MCHRAPKILLDRDIELLLPWPSASSCQQGNVRYRTWRYLSIAGKGGILLEGPSCMFQVYVLGFLAPSQRLSRASTRPQRFSQRLFGQGGGRRQVDLVRQIRQDVGIRLETLWMRGPTGPTGDWISGSPWVPKKSNSSSPTHGISHQVAKKTQTPNVDTQTVGRLIRGDHPKIQEGLERSTRNCGEITNNRDIT